MTENETYPAITRPPILVGAGFNKFEQQAVELAREETIAAQTLGAFSYFEWHGNSQDGRKNVMHWDPYKRAFYNSVGLENPGHQEAGRYLPRTLRTIKEAGQLAIVSVVSLSHEEPLEVLPVMTEWALEMGADVVEIDGSCANQNPKHPLLCMDVNATLEVVDSIRQRVGLNPQLAYKVASLHEGIIDSYKCEPDMKVDIITTLNAIAGQQAPVNPLTKRPYIDVHEGLASMSGPIIRDSARTNLMLWHNGPFRIFSLGGVDDGFEIALRQKAGAELVGGVQAFCRASDPRRVAQRWAQDYAQTIK